MREPNGCVRARHTLPFRRLAAAQCIGHEKAPGKGAFALSWIMLPEARRSAPWPERLTPPVCTSGDGGIIPLHHVLAQPAVMIVVVVVLHAHHRDAELHAGEHDAV